MKVKMSENENENENESENENENENESEMKVKMRTGTHRCHRCCRRLLLPSLLRSPLPPFLLLPLLVDFCPSHHCHGTFATISSAAAFVDCCLCPLPTSIAVVVTHHRHHCRRRQSKPITKKRAPRASWTPLSQPRLSRPLRKDARLLPPATARGSRPRRQYRRKLSSDSGPLSPTPASTRRHLGAPPLPT